MVALYTRRLVSLGRNYLTATGLAARRFGPAVVLVGIVGCSTLPKSPPLPNPEAPSDDEPPAPETEEELSSQVGLVEIIPPHVYVTPPPADPSAPTRFQLQVRVWDSKQELIPESDGYVPNWEASEDWVSFVALDGHKAVVEISQYPPLPYQVTVSAGIGGTSSTDATITILQDPTSITSDRILAKHTMGAAPSVAFVDGLLEIVDDAKCIDDGTLAFVRVALPGNLVWGCQSADAELSLFSSQSGMTYRNDIQWQPGEDVVDLEISQPDIRKLPIKIWIAVQDDNLNEVDLAAFKKEVSDQAMLDVELANDILETNRVGITLAVVGDIPGYVDGMQNHYYKCIDQFAIRTSGVLNVYYVNNVHLGRAHTCTRNEVQGEDIIHISWNLHSPTSLVHEIGHALALLMPGRYGHTDYLEGFRVDNVMWGWLDDRQKKNRDHFSLGQAFRMNVDRYSWINHSPAVDPVTPTVVASDGSLARDGNEIRIPCQCPDETKQPCPRLAADLGGDAPGNPGNGIDRCSDELELSNTDLSHNATALLHSRRWRADPGSCEWVEGVPGRLPNNPELHLWLPNIMDDPACNWSLIIFFDHHRMYYQTAPSDFFGYLYMDRLVVFGGTDVPNEPWDIPVNVWFEGSMGDYEADLDIASAKQVFGGQLDGGGTNKSGVTLDWNYPQSEEAWSETPGELTALLNQLHTPLLNGQRTSCPLGSSAGNYVTDGEINVYYIGSVTDVAAEFDFLETDRGEWCTDDNGTYYIVLAPSLPYSNTALAHHVGHALSLDHIVEGDELTWSNVMWKDPYPSGLDARVELTLGQVFRINLNPASWLNKSSGSLRNQLSLPTVDCAADPCPDVTGNY